MKNTLSNMEDILDRQISGYHRYILNGPARLRYVSRNLCELVGVGKDELLDDREDRYQQLVHPADREKYAEFVGSLSLKAQALTAEYRLMKRDGTVIYIKDSAVSRYLEDGAMVCDSVLADISDIKRENDELRFLNETIPCGFLKYTCEKQPRVTYINQTMIDLLRFPKEKNGESDDLELYKSNIFLMVPMEERRRFSDYLSRVYAAGGPVAGDMTLLRRDGTRAHIFGWVTRSVNMRGEAEFQCVCMDVTQRHKTKKSAETERYLKALSDVYDEIFEFDLDANTVKCLHCGDGSSFKSLEDIAMQMDGALDKWILGAVVPEDRDRVRSFFQAFCRKELYAPDARPPQLPYKALSSAGETKQYNGIFIKMNESVSFYCCRRVPDSDEAAALRTENDQLRENMKALVTRFFDGIAAFAVSPDGNVKPLYASENVSEFFGYTREEWLGLTEKFTPLESFVAHSEAAYEDFAELEKNGEAEFTYFDYRTETERKIRAICSPKEPGGDSPRYVMLYSVAEDGTEKSLPERRAVSIRTFGYFDVFVGDTPIAFRNKKSKELFALLVDRKGGYVTSEEAISFLWEDEPANTVTLSRYRKVALRLKNTLEEYGISDVIESVDGKRRIVREKVRCDLYDYLSGKAEYARLFKGSYLSNYSWGETTLGELSKHLEYAFPVTGRKSGEQYRDATRDPERPDHAL